ncbi:response regulator transcription factor [Bdellovibrio sp. 22V]|uniref:LuxR C-terminal-related transcriptional regulator n=1 Tax=Bdellovibrio TaxID=958 RepID=UPI002543BE5E|nr:response regulator transcription factor [Bdellovibrio sp. 22V]WII73691.1 response regulator transcription factor [Bdellovibrio sp. 22V]
MSQALSYLLVDDHALLVEGLKNLLGTHRPAWRCLGEAFNLADAKRLISKGDPSYVLLDHGIGDSTGLSLIEELLEVYSPSRFVLVSQLQDKKILRGYLHVGVKALIAKKDSSEALIEGIESLSSPSQVYLSESFKTLLGSEDPAEALTAREIEVIRLIALGKTNKDVGRDLNCSEFTIKTHKTNIMRKLNLKNSVELSVWALKNNLLL